MREVGIGLARLRRASKRDRRLILLFRVVGGRLDGERWEGGELVGAVRGRRGASWRRLEILQLILLMTYSTYSGFQRGHTVWCRTEPVQVTVAWVAFIFPVLSRLCLCGQSCNNALALHIYMFHSPLIDLTYWRKVDLPWSENAQFVSIGSETRTACGKPRTDIVLVKL